jgi:hypothetical protein
MLRRIALIFSVVITVAIVLGSRCRTEQLATEVETPVQAITLVSADVQKQLDDAGWPKQVGDRLGLWVSAGSQRLVGIEGGRILFSYPCSTALRGTGNKEGSYQTPLGWHEIRERFGDGLPFGTVFNERKPTGQTWQRDDKTEKDLVLTRIMWLAGLEPGVNRGKGIDSHDRYIYIHGTPAEDKLGTPASWGCVRLSNSDVIAVFEQCPSGTRVLITEW